MADEFLVRQFQERIKKGESVASVKRSFSSLFSESDIALAYEEYELLRKKAGDMPPAPKSRHRRAHFENPFLWSFNFLLTTPLPTFAVLFFLFYLVFKVSAVTAAMSQEQYVYYLLGHAVVFFGIVNIQAKLMQWLAQFSQDFGPGGNEFLKGIQLQMLNFAFILGFIRMSTAEPVLVLVLFVVLGIFFMIVTISLMYRVLLLKSCTLFLLFEVISFLLWGMAYVLRKLFF